MTRGVDDLLADLAEAADAAAELVGLGKERWDTERPLRLAGEAVVDRLGDIATKLPDEVIKATPEIPWREVKGMRIIAVHVGGGASLSPGVAGSRLRRPFRARHLRDRDAVFGSLAPDGPQHCSGLAGTGAKEPPAGARPGPDGRDEGWCCPG